jgi:hypothetical protein
MVMVTGIVGQSIKFQSKLKATRFANQEITKLTDQLTNDIRLANAPGKINSVYSASTHSFVNMNYKSGIALFHCEDNLCSPVHYKTTGNSNSDKPSGSFVGKANALVVFYSKDGTSVSKVYLCKPDGKLYYFVSNNLVVDIASYSNNLNTTNIIAGISGEITNSITLNLGGYTPDDGSLKDGTATMQQPYVSFNITAETSGDGLYGYEKSKVVLKSIITSRNYNQ